MSERDIGRLEGQLGMVIEKLDALDKKMDDLSGRMNKQEVKTAAYSLSSGGIGAAIVTLLTKAFKLDA